MPTLLSVALIITVFLLAFPAQIVSTQCNCVNGTNGIDGTNGLDGFNGTDGATGTFSGIIADTGFMVYDAAGSNTTLFAFDVAGLANSKTTIATNSSITNVTISLPPISGMAIVEDANGRTFLFPNEQIATDQNSGAGIQGTSTVSGRAAIRLGQYGSNTGIAGISGFKSRGLVIGSLVAVIPGDTLVRMTGTGVAYDNASIPIGGFWEIRAALVNVTGQNFVPTEASLQLVPLLGPINGRKEMLRVTSEGLQCIPERANSMAGVATTGVGGTIVVANTNIAAATRITLTIQDSGAIPTGVVYNSARVVGTSFTIASATLDVGVVVYWQLWCQTTP